MELFEQGVDMDKIRILSRGTLLWKKLGYPLITAGK